MILLKQCNKHNILLKNDIIVRFFNYDLLYTYSNILTIST